jgi:hypothetical protein
MVASGSPTYPKPSIATRALRSWIFEVKDDWTEGDILPLLKVSGDFITGLVINSGKRARIFINPINIDAYELYPK